MSIPFEPGPPVQEGSIPLCAPEIRGNEWAYVKQCLDSSWVSGGSFIDRFETAVSEFVGTEHAVAVLNGTAALHVALLVAGVEPDDEVLVSALTFVAPVNAIRYVGAWPVFMDADPVFWQMDPGKVEAFLNTECDWRNGRLINKTTGRRVKAILPVHILGHPCDMEPILNTARRFDLKVIEDATETLGARYQGEMVGHLGDIACLSFNSNKIITTGGGGMIITDNHEWADRARYLATQAKDDPIEYVHSEIGYNYRLNNIQAAMGVAQMENIEEFISKKRAIAAAYEEGFGSHDDIGLMQAQEGTEPTYWLYTILLPQGIGLEERKSVVARLNAEGVGTRPLWHPIHALPPYQGCQAYRIENSTGLYERGVSLPSSAGLTQEDQIRCIALLKECMATSIVSRKR